jgi:hypothetical protein
MFRKVRRALALISVLSAIAVIGGCATTYYQSPTLNQDWVPPSFTEPVEDGTDFRLGALGNVSLLSTGSITASGGGALLYGARAGLEASAGGAFTATLGWNAGGVVSGFLIGSRLSGPGTGWITENLLSFGGSAQASASLVIGNGTPLWFCIGPDIVYSLERGPYFERRKDFAASGTESHPIVDLSPGGNTMTFQGNLRFVWRAAEGGSISYGGAVGVCDPDFPNNLFVEDGNIESAGYIFLDFQKRTYRIYGSFGFGGGPVLTTGLIFGAELFLTR